MQKLLGNGSRKLSNFPSATHSRALSSLQALKIGLVFHGREARCRSLKQSRRVECLTYSAHDGSWMSRRHTNTLEFEFPLRSRGFVSVNEQRPVKCWAATAGVDAFRPFGQSGDGAQGFGAGIAKDIERRLPHYPIDFTDGLHPKALSAVAYMIFASLAPCFAFGGSATLLSRTCSLSFRGFARHLHMVCTSCLFQQFFRILTMQPFAYYDLISCCVTAQDGFSRHIISDGASRDHNKLYR